MSYDLMKLEPPYYVAIFTAVRTEVTEGYDEELEKMLGLAQKIDGLLGVEFAGAPEFSIALTYWKTMDAMNQWKNDPQHMATKEKGKSTWYEKYRTRICKVEVEYGN